MWACAGLVATFGVPRVTGFAIVTVDGWGEKAEEGSPVGHSVTLSPGDGRLGSLLMILALVATIGVIS